MSYLKVIRNEMPRLMHNLPGVVEERMEEALKKARAASQKAVDEAGEPATDTGALREGQAIQTARGDDFEAVKAAAKTAFVGNRSRYDPKGKYHTAERFEDLCGTLDPLPAPRSRYEIIGALVVLMIYGKWYEEGDAWDLTRREKRPASPWFEPSVRAWEAEEFKACFEGVFEEALRK